VQDSVHARERAVHGGSIEQVTLDNLNRIRIGRQAGKRAWHFGRGAGLDDVRTLESTKIAAQRWLHEIGALVAQKDPELLKTLERIEQLQEMFSVAPFEDRLAA
jgi:hypothetical protein